MDSPCQWDVIWPRYCTMQAGLMDAYSCPHIVVVLITYLILANGCCRFAVTRGDVFKIIATNLRLIRYFMIATDCYQLAFSCRNVLANGCYQCAFICNSVLAQGCYKHAVYPLRYLSKRVRLICSDNSICTCIYPLPGTYIRADRILWWIRS